MAYSFFRKKKLDKNKRKQPKTTQEIEKKDLHLTNNLEKNIENIKRTLSYSSDINTKPLKLQGVNAELLFIDTLSDRMDIQRTIDDLISSSYSLEESLTFSFKQYEAKDASLNILKDLLAGSAFIFLEGKKLPYSFMARKHDGRAVEAPENESVVRGSHEGFVESLETNLFLLRKNIVSPNLVVKTYQIGKEAPRPIGLAYLSTIADVKLVKNIEKRISSIDTDTLFSAAYLEAFIEDYTITPFPQTLKTERADRAVANLMEGRIALFCEGASAAIILPVSFFAFFQSPDDYNTRFTIGSFYRIIRFMAFFLAIVMPAFYIAIIGFHSEVLPSYLIFLAKQSVEGIPYRPLIEASIVEVMIELIREASLRLPTKIGPTIGIVGGLVIGDAIVKAGLVSNLMVVVVALTAISAYVFPTEEMSLTVRILRFPFMIAASFMGIYGILIALLVLIGHLCKLQPFGVSYLSPIVPLTLRDLKDTFIRAPIVTMNTRPKGSRNINSLRERFSRWWKKP